MAALAVPWRALSRTIRVVTVGEHQLVLEGLAAMITREPDMTVVASASTGAETLDLICRRRPDVVTLDLLLPYLSKAAPNRDLIAAIRGVHAGRRVIPGPVASKVAEHLLDETLTAREIQVLRLVARGNRNKQVAGRLSIAGETVRICRKLSQDDSRRPAALGCDVSVGRSIASCG